jgi:hypothetical protein
LSFRFSNVSYPTVYPTVDEVRDVLAPAYGDTYLQVLKGEGIYWGLGAEWRRPRPDRSIRRRWTPARRRLLAKKRAKQAAERESRERAMERAMESASLRQRLEDRAWQRTREAREQQARTQAAMSVLHMRLAGWRWSDEPVPTHLWSRRKWRS